MVNKWTLLVREHGDEAGTGTVCSEETLEGSLKPCQALNAASELSDQIPAGRRAWVKPYMAH